MWERIAVHFSGKKAWFLPYVVKDSHLFRGKKVQMLPHVEKVLWEGLAMHLEVSLNPSPGGEGFTGKGSHAFKGCRMGSSDKVSLWYVVLLINTRFRFFIL